MKGNSGGSGIHCSAGQKRGIVIMEDWVMLLLLQKNEFREDYQSTIWIFSLAVYVPNIPG